MDTAERHRRVGDLFLTVCDLRKDEQTSFLLRSCGDDDGMRSQVEAMLEEDSRVESLLALRAKRLRGLQDRARQDPSRKHKFGRKIEAGAGVRDTANHETPAALPEISGYQINEVLGQGGMGIVYRARQVDLDRDVALKILPAGAGAAAPSSVARFKREAAAAAQLRHGNIVSVYDFGKSVGCYYYAMELIVGYPLSTVIRELAARHHNVSAERGGAFNKGEGAQPSHTTASDASQRLVDLSWLDVGERPLGRGYFRQVAGWIAAVAEALQFAHDRGIVHRDVKPGNLMMSRDGRIMITDFGLAMSDHAQAITKTRAIVGTLRYLSPEQALGDRVPVDHRTDIYSLGATLYELLTFHPVFRAENDHQLLAAVIGSEPLPPSKLCPAVPSDLETICMKALEKLPAERYTSAAVFAKDLTAFLSDEPIAARRPGLTKRLRRYVGRRKLGIVVTCTTLVLIGAGLLVVGTHGKARRNEQAGELLSRGLVLQQDHRWDAAAEAYLAALDVDRDNVRALGNLAIIRKEQYNVQAVPDPTLLREADEYCDRALEVAPENAALWNVKGVVLKKLGAYTEAIEAYRAALAIESAPPEIVIAALDNLAEAQWLIGDDAAAEESIRHATDVAAATGTPAWYAWQDLAALALAHGNAEAAEYIQRGFAAKSEPSWRLYVTRARIHLMIDEVVDVASAVRDAYAALEAADPDPRVERVMALALLRSGDFGQAVVHAQNAIELGDVPAFGHLIAAIAEAKREQFDEAKAYFESAQDAWPRDLIEAGYVVSTKRGMLWFDTADELLSLLEEAEVLLDDEP